MGKGRKVFWFFGGMEVPEMQFGVTVSLIIIL